MTKAITDIEFVEQIFEPMRDLLALERAGRVHSGPLPPVVMMAEYAIQFPDAWNELSGKAKIGRGKDAEQAHAALCYGAVKLLDDQVALPEPLRMYILNVLLEQSLPGGKHQYKTPIRDGRIMLALRRLKDERGVNPTRGDDVRDRAGKPSGSATVAAVLRSSHGWDLDERGVEEVWNKRKKWERWSF